MNGLYPEARPYVNHHLEVDKPHVLHVAEYGNPKGLPVVFLHGGPGAGCEDYHSRFFDPERYRIVLFDQRGCGRSTPHAELALNTTPYLIEDIETIRRYLKIDKWMVFGGSWGSTLGLLYAQAHPDSVLGLVLRGIFLCRRHEIEWFYQQGASRIFPDYWQHYLAPIPEAERSDLLRAYYKRLTSDNELERMAAAKAWSGWEGRAVTLTNNAHVVSHFEGAHVALSMARIECHYFVNNSFIEENQIINHVDRIRHIPAILVHGRYDIVCPLENAWQLKTAWPESELKIIDCAGHSALEPGITDALVSATEKMSERLAS